MKKIALVLAIVLLSMSQLIAQTSTFDKGDNVFNLGIGIGSTLYSGFGNKSTVPPLSVSYERGVVNNIFDKGAIGIGGYLGYQSYKWESYGYGWKYSNLILGARGAFHYPFVEKLDTYVGLMAGFNVASSKWIGAGTQTFAHSSAGGLVGSLYVGGRYYFTKFFGVMGEIGYGITYLNLGVVIKI